MEIYIIFQSFPGRGGQSLKRLTNQFVISSVLDGGFNLKACFLSCLRLDPFLASCMQEDASKQTSPLVVSGINDVASW